MPKHSREETVKFAASHMKKNEKITMPELKKLGKAAGHNIYPLILGLARKVLGWKRKTKVAGRGPGRPPGKRGPGRPPGKRGPGRPPGSKNKRGPGRPPGRRGPGRPRKMAGAAGLTGIVAHFRDIEREVASLRSALSKIADIAAGA